MNKNVPERGMSKARWYELRGTTNGGMGRTLRQRERFIHISQQYQPVYKDVELGEGENKVTIKVIDRYDPVFARKVRRDDGTEKLVAVGRTYKNRNRIKGKRGRKMMGRRRRARLEAA